MKNTEIKFSFYELRGKRLLDSCLSTLGLVILLPLFALIAILLKFTSSGPIFYRQSRVGKAGQNFKILKFRTMQVDADKQGPSITVAGDSRITPTGRILRALKLDELPQLWNVLKGDMSLVGPRPEVPLYVQSYTEEQRKVLQVRPGITDLTSLAYRTEEALLASQPDAEHHYQEIVLPHKLSLNAEYILNITLKYDLSILGKTLFSLFLSRPLSKQAEA
ncbi:MAG TPA: sugar transferase [Terriglobales bacterium]|nr:sugar transferase [Terriglobales bacterium]